MRLSDEELRDIDKIIIIACGTSFYAGMVAKYAIEHWTRIPVEVELASEFRYRDPILDYSTLVVAISQSGETADTLQAIRHARSQRSKVLAICNTNGSTIPRESDAVIYTHAGPEIGVASTKGFLTQLVACYLLALYLAQVKGTRYGDEIDAGDGPAGGDPRPGPDGARRRRAGLRPRPRARRHRARCCSWAATPATRSRSRGRSSSRSWPTSTPRASPPASSSTARSRWSSDGLPVLCVVPPRGRDQLHDKMISGIQEVRARGARTICLAEEGDESITPYADVLVRLPSVPVLLQPLVAVVPLQLFACELATAMGHDVDQPRNLAKSVTVE